MVGSSTKRFVTLDVFTHARFSGNPLAVVPDARGLTDAQMQTITREFNLSETIFVFPPENPAHDARVRIFYPQGEMPFAGHPTLGCAIYLACVAQNRAGNPSGDFEQQIVLEEPAGVVPVRVWRRGGETQAEFQAPVTPQMCDGHLARDECAAALGLQLEDIAPLGGTVAQGGPRFGYIGLRDSAALDRARPSQPVFDTCQRRLDVGGFYVFAKGPAQDGLECDWQARMFDPMGGIPEDPATGSATAIFAARLLWMGAIGDGETRLRLSQGVQMGRASALGLRIEVAQGRLRFVHVSGGAVMVSRGALIVPPHSADR